MSLQFVGKTNIFLDTSKQESKKGECVFLKKKEWKRKPKRRVTKKKKRETIFQDTKKKTKHGQTKCKKVTQQKKETDKIILKVK